jgi:hypothetical protein
MLGCKTFSYYYGSETENQMMQIAEKKLRSVTELHDLLLAKATRISYDTQNLSIAQI